MEIELKETGHNQSHAIDESASQELQRNIPKAPSLQEFQRNVPKAPSLRWKTPFQLLFRINRNKSKVSEGKENKLPTENGVKYSTPAPPPKLSTTLPSSQQQPPDLQASQAAHDRELLYAALEKPVLYPSGFSVLRQVLVPHDQNYHKFYDQNEGVQLQVIETLKKILGIAASGNSRVEYVMSRKNDQPELKPTILICCADEEQKRKVNHHFKTQPWSMAGFLYDIEVDPVVLASGSIDLGSLRGNVVRSLDPVNYETLCGLACEVFAETDKENSTSLNTLTLGGLICVDKHSLYALTTAHSFTEPSNSDNPSSNTTNLDSVFLGTMYQFEYLDRVISLGPEKKLPQATWAWDWALLRVDQAAYYRPNSFQARYFDTQQVFIESHLTEEQLSDGEVWVCSASKGPRLAMLYADRTLMTFRNSTFEARSIGLTEELADGDSGSWVVRDGKLCGYIYSRILHQPWAYMLPIDPVFQEIGRVLSPTPSETVTVEVATRAEIERARHTKPDSRLYPDSMPVSTFKHSDTRITPANGSDPEFGLSTSTSGDKDRSTDSTAVQASNPLDTKIAPASGSALKFELPNSKSRVKSLYTDSTVVPASNPSSMKIVSASGSELKFELPKVSYGDKNLSTDSSAVSLFKPSDTRLISTDSSAVSLYTRLISTDSSAVSLLEPSDTKFSLPSGSNPAENEPELSGDTEDGGGLSTNFDTAGLRMASLSTGYQDQKESDPIVTMAKRAIISLYRLNQSLVVGSYLMNKMIKDPYVPEKIRQLLQRVRLQDIICQDFLRNLFTTYGDATASIILKDSNDSNLSNAAEVIIENLMRALGISKAEFVFDILASMDKRLGYLHNGADSIVDISRKKGIVRTFLSLKFRTQISRIEALLDGLELSNNQLHGLLFQPAFHQSVQGVYTKKNLSRSELPLELYRIFSLVSAPFGFFYPVVGLRLPYPTINVFSTIPQDSVQQLSLFYDLRGMPGVLGDKLRYKVNDRVESRTWKSPKFVWAPDVFELNRNSCWDCEIEQSISSVGIDRVNDISSLKRMLENSGNTPQLSRIPITFDGNAHHMVLYKNPETKPARTLSNMARFFEDEHQKQALNPMQVSSSRFIGFALKLSYSILKLSSTPWVDADWIWENILVTMGSDRDVDPEVFIVHELQSADDNLTQLLNRAHSNSQVLKEPILTRLGFALTELAFRKRFDVSDDMRMHRLAIELSDSGQIAMKEGQIYGDVVKACLTHSYSSGSEIKTINSSHPNFQDAVQEAILSPLHNLWSSMKKAGNKNPQTKYNVSPKSIVRGEKSREEDTPSVRQPIEELEMPNSEFPGLSVA